MEKKMKEKNKNPNNNIDNKQAGTANNWFGFLQNGNSKNDEEGSMEFSLSGLFKCMLCTHKKDDGEKRQLAQIAESLKMLNKKMDAIEK